MAHRVFITGNSSGLGHGLTAEYLSRGWTVYGLSRRGCRDLSGERLHDGICDLSDRESITPSLQALLSDVAALDLVILNAGVLGDLRNMTETPLDDILEVMQINVWANKLILDWLHEERTGIDQIVLISSGAAVNANKGWGAYSLSKAALNMLAMLYAHEFPSTHLCALAPGLVDTAMQDYLCDPKGVDATEFPSVNKLRNARGTPDMPRPRAAAIRIADVLPALKRYPSGAFVDIRTM